ncbi:MAG: hypothetical protein ACYTEK_15580 [Planctomycetota bacterium]|jgi:hypothetical protein
MRPFDLHHNAIILDFMNTALPDFILAFTFFTSLVFAIFNKHFGQRRPAIAMSAAVGFALATGLIWWERATGLSIRNLGPIAVGFAIIVLAFVMYKAIGQIGGSWAGAAIAFGASILVAKLLELNIPIDPDVIQAVMLVALIVGILALVNYTRGHSPYPVRTAYEVPIVRHDMRDLYQDRRLSNRLRDQFRRLRHESRDLVEHPEQTGQILLQLRRTLPAEGFLTEKMAQLRTKAHQIRNGHIARLEETAKVFAKLPTSTKKKAAAQLVSRYKQIAGIDTRLERLDGSVAEIERRIRDLTQKAQQYATRHDYRKLDETLKTADKLQQHNSRLIKTIERTEERLSAIAKKVANEVRQIEK